MECPEHDDMCAGCFEEWLTEQLAIAHGALTDSLDAPEGSERIRNIVHALEHLEEVLEVLLDDEDVA